MVILAVAVGSYVLRALPLLLGSRWTASPTFERRAAHGGTAALAALVAVGLRRDAIGIADTAAVLAAAGTALVMALRGASLLRVLVVGTAVHVVVQVVAVAPW